MKKTFFLINLFFIAFFIFFISSSSKFSYAYTSCYTSVTCGSTICDDPKCKILTPPLLEITSSEFKNKCFCVSGTDKTWEELIERVKTVFVANGSIVNPALVPSVGSGDMGESILAKILIAIIRIFFIIGSIAVLIYFLLGGLAWITSGGEKAGLENAKTKFTAGFIGIVIIASLYAVTKILADIVGIEFFKTFIITWPTIQ